MAAAERKGTAVVLQPVQDVHGLRADACLEDGEARGYDTTIDVRANGEACRGLARDDRNGCECFEVRLLWIVCALARADGLGREAELSVRVPRDTRGARPDRKDRTWGSRAKN